MGRATSFQNPTPSVMPETLRETAMMAGAASAAANLVKSMPRAQRDVCRNRPRVVSGRRWGIALLALLVAIAGCSDGPQADTGDVVGTTSGTSGAPPSTSAEPISVETSD